MPDVGLAVEQAKEVLGTSSTEVTVIGLMLAVIIGSWYIIWRQSKVIEELNDKIIEVVGKFESLSTEILIYLRLKK